MLRIVMMIIALVALASSASADRRQFVWTYQTHTMPEGVSELEFYQTTKLDQTDSWEYRIEVEHGFSPRFDLAVYQIFSQKEGASFEWDAVQLRARYRLAEPGAMLLDPVLYLEYNRKIDLARQNRVEAKLLLGSTAGGWAFAINPVYEFFWAPGDPVHEIGLDVGLARNLSYSLSVGVESTSRLEFVSEADDETSSYFGPTVSLASGRVFYSIGAAWGLTDESNDARVRFLMGIGI